MNDQPEESLEQILVDIKDGVSRLLKEAPGKQPTDYRGQFQSMATEVNNISKRFEAIKNEMVRPEKVAHWEYTLSEYSKDLGGLASSISAHLQKSEKQSLWNKSGRLALTALAGLLLGFLTSDPVLPIMNNLGTTMLGQITADNCESLGGRIERGGDHRNYCFKWVEKGE